MKLSSLDKTVKVCKRS